MARKVAQRLRRGRAAKMIYLYGRSRTDGRSDQKDLLGGKGANLAQMTSIGLPVPPGFTITTRVCEQFYRNAQKLPAVLRSELRKAIAFVEAETDKGFGDLQNPLLLSVRSGAAVSMPGMMNTVLNLGLNDRSVMALSNATGNERFAYDAYRRLINMYGDVVLGVDHEHFEAAFNKIKLNYGAKQDTQVPTRGMIELCDAYKQVCRRRTGHEFPQDPYHQLELAVEAVFGSWMTSRAVRYRQVENITGLLGTAVNGQAMVFGNMGDDSGTGVAFTRNPSTGKNEFYGEYLVNAQGEDVVAGIRTPMPVARMAAWNRTVYKQLLQIKKKLEQHYRDMQDIEFTIERGRLYMLQTRTGKRTGAAAVKIARDMVREKRIDQDTALLRIPAEDLTQLLLPSFDPGAKRGATVLTVGLPASPGAAVGKLAFTAEEAVNRAQDGQKVLLVRSQTSPEDIDGMHSAVGILTSTGGMTSHAAVVARGWGRCCVAGAGAIQIHEKARNITVNGQSYNHDDTLSIDGSTGQVMVGTVSTRTPQLSGDFAQIMRWADTRRRLKVRTNADTPLDADRARRFGAEGIGLCRTEHMFFEGNRITAMREMILADNVADRHTALDRLLPFQREDFIGIFTAMKGLPVTVRLLDPPLHEFLPHDAKSQAELARRLGVSLKHLKARVAQLHEANPMLGHRGCRLSVTYPEILQMQVRAITEATIACRKKRIAARPEIMIPLVGTDRELQMLRQATEQTIEQVRNESNDRRRIQIPIGTMIEIPRSALTADQIGVHADFFSFGTNDLTQMTFGYSRDDANTFLPDYLQKEVLAHDPFQSLDTAGVGQLMEMAVTKGRGVCKDLKCGICGEHGGDPASIRFCHDIGLDYVSCSPFRVPVARLAAAQAALSSI